MTRFAPKKHYKIRFKYDNSKTLKVSVDLAMSEKTNEIVQKSKPIQFNSNHFGQTVPKLFLDEKTADVHFLIVKEEHRIPAHKSILAKGSDTFYNMFYDVPIADLPTADVQIMNVTVDGFTQFLRFFYTDEVEVSVENVGQIMYLGEKYKVAECLKIGAKLLDEHLPMEQVCCAYELAIKYNCSLLQTRLDKKIVKQPQFVFQTDAFGKCSREVLKRILEVEFLPCSPEELFDVCMSWAAKACKRDGLSPNIMENRRKQLGECLHLIPFYLMDSKQILEYVTKYKNLFDRDELAEIIRIMGAESPVKLTIFKYKKCFLQRIDSNGKFI